MVTTEFERGAYNPVITRRAESALPTAKLTITPLEINGLYTKTTDALGDALKKPFENIIGRFRNHLAPEHITNLRAAMKHMDLLTLTEETETRLVNIADFLKLRYQIMRCLSRFKNTGIKDPHIGNPFVL